jgi:glycine/D-amino acid oxidase-like deaminating enzyme
MVRVLGPTGEARLAAVNQARPARSAEAADQARKLEKVFDLSVGKYDLTVRSGPSFTSRREEAATQMIELIRAYPPAAPMIGDLLARNLDWPGADEIAQRLSAMLPAQIKGAGPEVEQAQAQMAKLVQALQAAQQKIAALEQDGGHAMRRLEIEAFEAETNRMRVMGALAEGKSPPPG